MNTPTITLYSVKFIKDGKVVFLTSVDAEDKRSGQVAAWRKLWIRHPDANRRTHRLVLEVN